MSILDKKHILTINLDDSSIEYSNKIKFYNTDKNISNLYVKIKKTNNDGVTVDLTETDLAGLILKLTVVKPKTNQTREMTGVLTTELTDYTCAIYKFDLPVEFTNQVGPVYGEFELTDELENGESMTIDPFSYVIKASKLTGLNAEIESNPDLPVLKELIEEVKETAQTVNNIDNVNVSDTKTYSNKKIEEKFSGVSSQIKDIVINVANYGVVGDGITDDTQTLQNILNIADKKRVEIPVNFKCRITSSLTIPENIILDVKGKIICDGDVDYWIYGKDNKRVICENLNIEVLKVFEERQYLNRAICCEKHDYFEVKTADIKGASTSIHALNGNEFICGIINLKNVYGTEAQYGYGVNTSAQKTFIDKLIVENELSSHGRHALYINGGQCKKVDVNYINIKNFNRNPINITITEDIETDINIKTIYLDNTNVSPLTDETGSINETTNNYNKLHININTIIAKRLNNPVLSSLSNSDYINIDNIIITDLLQPFRNSFIVHFRNGKNKTVKNIFCESLKDGWLCCAYFRDTENPSLNYCYVGGNLGQHSVRLRDCKNVKLGVIDSTIPKIYNTGSTIYNTNLKQNISYNDGNVFNGESKDGDLIYRNNPRKGDVIGWVYCEDEYLPYAQVSCRELDGSPANVLVPYFLGEEVFDKTNKVWYKSVGSAIGNWKQITNI